MSAFGSESDSAATMALKQLGLFRSDVQIVEAGGTLTRLAALRIGRARGHAPERTCRYGSQTQAVCRCSPISKPICRGYSPPLRWTGIISPNHRQQAREFLQAYIEGIYLALSDPALRQKSTRRTVQGNFSGRTGCDLCGFPCACAARRRAQPRRRRADVARIAGKPQRSGQRRIEDYIDTSVLSDLRRSGFFDELKQRYRIR